MKEYEAYIFDFGGVFIEIDYQKTKSEFEKLGLKDFQYHFSQQDQSKLFNDLEVGGISSQRFINELMLSLRSGTSPNQVVFAWNAMLGEILVKNVMIAQKLKEAGKKCFLLSNTNEIHIKPAFNKWTNQKIIQPAELFDEVFLSHEMGLRKPNVQTFAFVIDRHQLNPQKTLFIDDSLQHIEGARAIGLDAIHIESNGDLKTYLS